MSDDDYDDRGAEDAHGRKVVADSQPRTSVGELQDMVDDLIAHMEAAKSMPLSSNVLVDREAFLDRLYRLRSELPDELRAARWMVREREAFVARTNERANEILERAQNESRRLVSESYVLAEAVEEANILVRRAEGDARRTRLEAEDEIERGLESVEQLMADLIRKIHGARSELHEARPPAPDVPY